MERQAFYVSDQTHSRKSHPVLPPWEVREMAQVPFIEPGSPPLVQPLARRDAQGLFSPSRASSQVGHRPKVSATVSAPCASEYGSPVSEDVSQIPWKSASTIPAASPPPYEPRTYEVTPSIPKSPKTAPPIPAWPVRAPPTPPDSFLTKSPSRSPSASPADKHPIKALPGTISSREMPAKQRSRTRAKSHNREGRSNRSHSQPVPRDKPQKPFGRRFKSAFREMFKRDPVDESQFEKIGERHWTDEC